MDVYQEITNRIIAELEKGVIPWEKPWVANGGCIKHVKGEPYSLLNQMLLGRPGEWLTFDQCKKEGGKVKNGEKASIVIFWKWLTVKDEETEELKEVPFLRYSHVFHIDQCEGISAKHTKEQPLPSAAEANDAAEQIVEGYISRSGIKLMHEEGDRAFYRQSSDTIVVPVMDQFKSTAEYYSTLFHEMTHSTGHVSRLNRLEKTASFGTESYSKEELVAEIGAATLVNHVGLESGKSLRNSAAYIQNWLSVLKDDKRFIVSASGKAEKAVNLIIGEEEKAA